MRCRISENILSKFRESAEFLCCQLKSKLQNNKKKRLLCENRCPLRVALKTFGHDIIVTFSCLNPNPNTIFKLNF